MVFNRCTRWRDWCTRGWFDWEEEGWPFWSNLGHTKSYWRWRHLPNILFVHYGDLWADPHTHIARIARFIGVNDDDALIDTVVTKTNFDVVRRISD